MLLRSSLLSVLYLAPAVAVSAHPPAGIVINDSGEVFFCDFTEHRIMKVNAQGELSVFFSRADDETFRVPHHLSIDEEGNLYTVADMGGRVLRIAPDGSHEQLYPPADWYGLDFIGAGGDPFTVDAQGHIYCVNYRRSRYSQILRVTSRGVIENFAGGAWGDDDGPADEAGFGALHGACFAWDDQGNLYLTDHGTRIRRIGPEGRVTTIASNEMNPPAAFGGLYGLAVSDDGSMYAADWNRRVIWRVSPDGAVERFAGTGERASHDGPADQAAFNSPSGVTVGPDGAIYVLEVSERDTPLRVRKIDAQGEVTTVASTEEAGANDDSDERQPRDLMTHHRPSGASPGRR